MVRFVGLLLVVLVAIVSLGVFVGDAEAGGRVIVRNGLLGFRQAVVIDNRPQFVQQFRFAPQAIVVPQQQFFAPAPVQQFRTFQSFSLPFSGGGGCGALFVP